jgi:hypothetical protein
MPFEDQLVRIMTPGFSPAYEDRIRQFDKLREEMNIELADTKDIVKKILDDLIVLLNSGEVNAGGHLSDHAEEHMGPIRACERILERIEQGD